jgi:hypothetical protein
MTAIEEPNSAAERMAQLADKAGQARAEYTEQKEDSDKEAVQKLARTWLAKNAEERAKAVAVHGDDPRNWPSWSHRAAVVAGWPLVHVESASSSAQDVADVLGTWSPYSDGISGDLYVHGGALAAYRPIGGHLSTDKTLAEMTPALAGEHVFRNAATYTWAKLPDDPGLLEKFMAEADSLGFEVDDRGNAFRWRKRARPAMDAVQGYLADPAYTGARTLRELVRRPVVDWYGRDVHEGGYDALSGLLLDLPRSESHPPMPPEGVSVDQARAAAAEIRRIFGDFSWADDASYANWFATAVTVAGRRLFTGAPGRYLSVPGLAVYAGARDSGKSTVCDALGGLYGSAPLDYPSPRTGSPDEELEKRVLATYRDRPDAGVMLINNLPNGVLVDSAVLAKVVLDAQISGRKLGKSQTLTFPNNKIVVINGNRFKLADDLTTRFLYCGLNVPTAEQRAAPKSEPGLDAKVLQPDFQTKLLTLLRAVVLSWHAAGQPLGNPKTIRGNFREWAAKVAGVLDFVGVPGFLDNWDQLADDDEASDPVRDRVRTLHAVMGEEAEFTTADLVDKLKTPWGGAALNAGDAPALAELRADLADTHNSDGTWSARKVGRRLSAACDMPARLSGGAHVRLHRRLLDGVARYAVVPH